VDPTLLAAIGVGLYFFLGRGAPTDIPPDDGEPDRTPADPRDIAPGQDADPGAPSDDRQLTRGGAVVRPGEYVDGQSIVTFDAIPYAVFFGAQSGYTEWSPMASGLSAPAWGACGMPTVEMGRMGRAVVPANQNEMLKRSIVSDYSLCRAPLKKGARFSGIVSRRVNGDRSPTWLPQDPTLHPAYTAAGGRANNPGVNGRYPDAGPQDGDTDGGRLRRMRGLRTAQGIPLVLAEDSVNFSSINLAASAGETGRGDQFRLFIGAREWTALQIGADGRVAQLTRAQAEMRLAWVVPGMLSSVAANNDRSIRAMRPRIVGADGRPGSRNPWEIAPFRGWNVPDPFDLAPDDLRLRFTMGAIGEQGRDLFFRPSKQNLVPPAKAWFCTGTSRGWSIAHPFTFEGDCTSSAQHQTKNTGRATPFGNRFVGPEDCEDGPCEGVYGPYFWARGTASQYAGTADRDPDRRPMIPFALEAPLLLRAVVSRQFVRVISASVSLPLILPGQEA